MKYFSGFCLQEEQALFESFTCKGDFCVVGFSYGAQKALEYVFTCKERVDKLQLISPAFFQDKSEKFKKLQTLSFKKKPELYCENFLKNVTSQDLSQYFKMGTAQELQELLCYSWDKQKLQSIMQNGTEIEVYLGENDKIINSLHVKNFFQEFATIYYIKDGGHILC